MTDWTSGYVADIDYIPGFHAEQMPAHLDMICLVQGVHPPRRRGEPFAYCELGCGLGETALTLAACHPEADVRAYDFNPGHIAYAQATARAAGIGNVRLEERSFADLAAAEIEGGPFDYVTLHGVWTWIGRERQLEIVDLLLRLVKPGGVVAVTYNAQPGWSREMPLQRLLYDFARTCEGRSDERIEAAFQFAQAMHETGSLAIDAAFLRILLDKRRRELVYLVHEYLNGAWQPVYHVDLAADMARAKLSFVGSATVLENFSPLLFTEDQRRLIAAAPPSMRETVRDHFNPRIFRRDVFVRGPRAIAPLPKARLLDELELVSGSLEAEGDTKVELPGGEIEFKSPFYPFLSAALAQGPASLAQIRSRPGAPEAPAPEEILAVGLETRMALVRERQPHEREIDRVRAINLAFVRNAIAHGRSSVALAAIAVGGGLPIPLIPMLAYEALATGTAASGEPLALRCLQLLRERGEHLRRDGDVVDDPGEMLAILQSKAGHIVDVMLPLWRRLGAI